MSLGLPGHLASRVLNDGIARGTRTVAGLALLGSLAVHTLLHSAQSPTAALSTFVAIAAAGGALVLLVLRSSALTAVLYLVTGSVAILASSASALAVPSAWMQPAASVVHLVGIAMVMIGGVAPTRNSGLLWTALAIAAVLASQTLATALLGGRGHVPWMPWGAAVIVAIIYLVTGSRRVRRVRLAQPDIHRAGRDEKVAEMRSGVERRAAALLHDTILGSLSAIANGPLGPIRPELSRAVEMDLDRILGQDWTEAPHPSTAAPVDRVLAATVAEVESLGLAVRVTGDVATLERLSPSSAHALSLAVKQLLVNVHRHAGVPHAEVVVVGYPDSLSVMVVDDGVGFVPESVGADRLGLRTSVVDRIEQLGGSVRLWSTPGRGTSVLVALPVEQPTVLLEKPEGDEDAGRAPVATAGVSPSRSAVEEAR